MKELVEFLATSLVDDPSAVDVTEKDTPDAKVFYLSVKKEDLGKVIGKKGRTAKAMRALLGAVGAKHKMRVLLEIVEPDRAEGETCEVPKIDTGSDVDND